jgi:AraC family transcriptional regulator
MQPQIVSKPAFAVVGMKYRGKADGDKLKHLWNQFGPHMADLKDTVNPNVCYGVMGNYDEATGEFDYVAGCEVKSTATVPADMTRWDVPAQKYAVFACTLPTMGDAYNFAYQQWLPQSGYRHAGSPEFELYDEKFNPQDPTATMYIYVPIVSAN